MIQKIPSGANGSFKGFIYKDNKCIGEVLAPTVQGVKDEALAQIRRFHAQPEEQHFVLGSSGGWVKEQR